LIGALLLVTVWLGACAPTTPTGGLDLVVTGLSTGVPARVTLIAPNGSARLFTASARIPGLVPGRYEVVAADVCATAVTPCAETDLFRPSLPSREVDVLAGAVHEVGVHYGCALLAPPDPALGMALLSAIREQRADPNAVLSCANLEALTSFSPSEVGITNLDGLQHARALEHLSLLLNPGIADLTPIAGLIGLRNLAVGCSAILCTDAPIEDLAAVSGLVHLERLTVSGARATELPDLSRLSSLRDLALRHVELRDLGPLADLPSLTTLDLGFCIVSSPPPYRRSELQDLTPLRDLRGLTRLDLGCHDIRDVEPLAGMTELRYLNLGFNRVTDLTPLAGLAALETLSVRDNPVRSLAVAFGWPRLGELRAQATRVDDLRPFYLHVGAHDGLERLYLANSCVSTYGVPNAGYAAAIAAAGVTLSASRDPGVCGVPYRPPPALATFELDLEGWTTAGDAMNVRRLPIGGPTGGAYLEADDGQQGVGWYWQAGPVFLGNASAFLGGQLVVALAQSATDAPWSADDVIVEGASRTLKVQHGVAIGTEWTTVTVPLVAAAGWTTDGRAATDADLAEVFADVTSLRIRGEYRFGADTGRLGFVRLEPPSP